MTNRMCCVAKNKAVGCEYSVIHDSPTLERGIVAECFLADASSFLLLLFSFAGREIYSG